MLGKALFWWLCTYATLKLIQIVFGGRPAFDASATGWRQTLLRHEPWLLAIAFALAVPAVLGNHWYLHRGYTRVYAQATDCYGKLRALDRLADVGKKADGYTVYKMIVGYQGAAELAAQSLQFEPAVLNKALVDKMTLYIGLYTGLSRHNDHRKIRDETTAIERCLNAPAIEL